MKEDKIHEIIEEQDPEAKQRILQRVLSQIDVTAPAPVPAHKTNPNPRKVKWAVAAAVALVCVITLAVVLPLTLGNSDGVRFCNEDQYSTAILGQTLRDYSSAHGGDILYADWYDVAEEVTTVYGHIKDDPDDVVFLQEKIVNMNTGVMLTLSVTDDKTRVDRFENFFLNNEEHNIAGLTVKWRSDNQNTSATFEYKSHIYYLQIDVRDGQELLTEIIQGMLK